MLARQFFLEFIDRWCCCWFFSEPMPRVVATGGDSELAVVVVPGSDLDGDG